MSYGGTGNTYKYYGQNERGEHGNDTVGAEPEYERHLGVLQAPPAHLVQNTQSYTPAPDAFVQGYPPVLPPVMNPYTNTAPGYPQEPGYPIANTLQQPISPLYPPMGTSQVPRIQSSLYPVQQYTAHIDTQPETPPHGSPQQGVIVDERPGILFQSLSCKRKIILGTIGVTIFILISIVRAIA